MTKEEQIKEMSDNLCSIAHYDFCKDTACVVCPVKQFVENIYNAGYRKQVEATRGLHLGHMYYCSNCGKLTYMDKFCANCGAKVKGIE